MPNPELAELRLHEFISLLVNVAFLRDNPRFVLSKDPNKMKEETVPVLQCVQNMVNEHLPRMQTGDAAAFVTVRDLCRLCMDASQQNYASDHYDCVGT